MNRQSLLHKALLTRVPLPLQLESYLRKITPVVQQLQDDFPDLRYDKRSVAQLIADFLQFLENTLGVGASDEHFQIQRDQHSNTY